MNCRAFLLASALAAAATPSMAQTAPTDGAGASSAVPFQYDTEQVRALQQRLNQEGFSSGHVDGVWGPITSKAVLEYQRKAGLQLTGQLDVATLRALGLLAAAQPTTPPLVAEPPAAPAPRPVVQAPQAAALPVAPAPPSPVAPPLAAATPPAVPLGATAGASGGPSGAGAGTGRPEPTPGANSFTEGQARGRIEDQGFTNVGELRKSDEGIWRGMATKDGQHTAVWLDYQGEVGRQ